MLQWMPLLVTLWHHSQDVQVKGTLIQRHKNPDPVIDRCMAASVLLLVGPCDAIVEAVIAKAKALTRGTSGGQVGAIIDKASQRR